MIIKLIAPINIWDFLVVTADNEVYRCETVIDANANPTGQVIKTLLLLDQV